MNEDSFGSSSTVNLIYEGELTVDGVGTPFTERKRGAVQSLHSKLIPHRGRGQVPMHFS